MRKKITEGFMDIYFCCHVNQNILPIALNDFRNVFWNEMLYKSG